MTIFSVRINNGPVQVFETKNGSYWLAVATALATLEYISNEELDIIEIWAEHLFSDYGPYTYAYNGREIFSYISIEK